MDPIEVAIEKHRQAAPHVQLGMTKQEAMTILQPTQSGLAASRVRPPESFMHEGRAVEIFYARSGWVSDGRLTDDELTPYVFVDGRLAAIGWTSLGGMKSIGKGP